MRAAFGNQGISVPQQQAQWMSKPAGDTNPLSYLKSVDQITVKQVVSMTEMVFSVASASKYGVFNNRGEQMFYAHEESDHCQRQCCQKTRAFVLHIADQGNQEIIRLERQFRCCAGCSQLACFEAFRQEISVDSPPGTRIGRIVQECSIGRAQYSVKDEKDNEILTISAPRCICDGPYSCCCDNTFTIYGSDKEHEIGTVKKKYRGYIAEALTSADEFALQFPMDLDVKMKALALASVFLIDFAHFAVVEQQNRR